jgi:hypothetical protein
VLEARLFFSQLAVFQAAGQVFKLLKAGDFPLLMIFGMLRGLVCGRFDQYVSRRRGSGKDLSMRNLAAVLLFFLAGNALFAGGKAEKPTVYHDMWTLCITEADVSDLPPSRAAVRSVALQTITRSLAAVDRRARLSEEEAYYRNAVWRTAERDAAKKIADKQKQRDELLFQGNKDWKYQQDLKKIDAELVTLREALDKTKTDAPAIERGPRFALTSENLAYTFSAPPKIGEEYYFCAKNKIDGFLVSRITEFYGRVVFEVRLYSLFARSYTYEDSAIFSTEDMEIALLELSDRIIENVSQSPAAGLIVTTEPDTAMIAVNDRYAGRGESELIVRNAGPVSVEVFADGYRSHTDEIELLPELVTELSVRLPPLPIAGITVDTTEPAALYRGALYVGETPFALSAPHDTWLSLMAETPDQKSSSTAFLVNESALLMKPLEPPKQDAVDKARRGFYGAWGRFWIALPLALVVNGMYSSYLSAYNSPAGVKTEDDFNTAKTFQYATGIAVGVAVGFGVEFAARLVYYVVVSNRERTPLVAKLETVAPGESAAVETTATAIDEEDAVEAEEVAPEAVAPEATAPEAVAPIENQTDRNGPDG